MTDTAPLVGSVHRHYKGGLYKVIAIARHHEDGDAHVVYASEKDGSVFVRPLSGHVLDPDGWSTPTDDGKTRFSPVPDMTTAVDCDADTDVIVWSFPALVDGKIEYQTIKQRDGRDDGQVTLSPGLPNDSCWNTAEEFPYQYSAEDGLTDEQRTMAKDCDVAEFVRANRNGIVISFFRGTGGWKKFTWEDGRELSFGSAKDVDWFLGAALNNGAISL